ncbi:hypothetical protein BXZ70DRAFT_1011002 [Cristinia sonorae]|uniref:Uncharacterized protein n=1 Tax=Cristinia sonorae TaxID=1940300 RepID=A0A8K0XLV9_9AGAR|nr:hypothetical protein BXZ70DRAFT_1011002 [Cristinia sonorae]
MSVSTGPANYCGQSECHPDSTTPQQDHMRKFNEANPRLLSFVYMARSATALNHKAASPKYNASEPLEQIFFDFGINMQEILGDVVKDHKKGSAVPVGQNLGQALDRVHGLERDIKDVLQGIRLLQEQGSA